MAEKLSVVEVVSFTVSLDQSRMPMTMCVLLGQLRLTPTERGGIFFPQIKMGFHIRFVLRRVCYLPVSTEKPDCSQASMVVL